KAPVVYRLNLRDPQGIFFAGRVHIRNKDVVYVANAESAQLMKFLGMVAQVASAVNGGVTVVDRTSNLDD
ncbi:MAG TPA: polysaccharide export protein, partial [Kaistiaceae bacterium]|nr:polysaccharide export protein [Kaistiaceae bacterium]